MRGELARSAEFALRADVALDIDGVAALVGASGAGKSTLLRVIAGFETHAPMTVEVDGERWQDAAAPRRRNLAPHRRSVGTVFQDSRLFPHLDAAGNLAFAAKVKRPGVRLEYDEVVEFLDLAPLLTLYPHQLSGGQRQRVALGRTLLAPAKLWLFDEPMSSLDAASRREIAPYLRELCRRHAVPIVYVSHSLPEMLAIAEKVLVVAAGQVAPATSIEEFSTSQASAVHGDDAGAVIACRFEGYDPRYRLSQLDFEGAVLHVPGDLSAAAPRIVLHIPARDVSLSTAPVHHVSILNRVDGRIDAVDAGGDSALVRVRCGRQFLLARVTHRSADELGLTPGVRVQALIKSVAVRTGDV